MLVAVPASRVPYIAKALALAFVGVCLLVAVLDAASPYGSIRTIPAVAVATAILGLTAIAPLAAGLFVGVQAHRLIGSAALGWIAGVGVWLLLGIALYAGSERLPWVGARIQQVHDSSDSD